MSFAGIIRESIAPYKGPVRMLLLEILVTCNHTDNPAFLFDNKPLPLKRGQLVTSLPKLAEQTGLSIQQVRTALAHLEANRQLTNYTTDILTKRGRLLTIVNVDLFLVSQNEQQTHQQTHQQATNRQVTVNNKDNKETNKKITNKPIKLPFTELPEDWKTFCRGEMNWNEQQMQSAWIAFRDYSLSANCKTPERKDWFLTFKNSCRAGYTKPSVNLKVVDYRNELPSWRDEA